MDRLCGAGGRRGQPSQRRHTDLQQTRPLPRPAAGCQALPLVLPAVLPPGPTMYLSTPLLAVKMHTPTIVRPYHNEGSDVSTWSTCPQQKLIHVHDFPLCSVESYSAIPKERYKNALLHAENAKMDYALKDYHCHRMLIILIYYYSGQQCSIAPRSWASCFVYHDLDKQCVLWWIVTSPQSVSISEKWFISRGRCQVSLCEPWGEESRCLRKITGPRRSSSQSAKRNPSAGLLK